MGNLGGAELIFLLIIAFLIIGPDKMPRAGKMLGKFYESFKRSMNEIKTEINQEIMEPIENSNHEFIKSVKNEAETMQKTIESAKDDLRDHMKL